MRLRVIRDALPEGRVLRPEQVQGLLEDEDRLLAFALGSHSLVFVVSKDAIRSYPLAVGEKKVTAKLVQAAVEAYVHHLASRRAAENARTGRALFRMLVPEAAWDEIRSAKRVYVLPHGALHQLPFEALVVREHETKPVYWLQEGPPIAYATSASVLATLMRRPKAPTAGATVVALGDPVFEGASRWPATGVVVTDVTPSSEAATANLRPGDVITSYGGEPTASFEDVVSLIRKAQAGAPVPLEYEREGATRTVEVKPGPLGVLLARDPPPVAGPKLLSRTAVGVVRRGDRRHLRPLPGTRVEIQSIASMVKAGDLDVSVRPLLGADATEDALFRAADGARILHLATHGLVDPGKGPREASLALTPPRLPVPGNDGFLSLGDLLEHWGSHLQGTELVVLSACESHRGKLDKHEGMLALPWGFCFAGARSCIASLWPVDDKATATLMSALYRHLLAGNTLRPCDALHTARRALMKTHPDPYYWAPFVFVGAP